MATAKNKKCWAKVETPTATSVDIAFRSNIELYTGDVATATGIAVATAESELALPTIPINTLVKAGMLYKVIVQTAGTSTTPPITKIMLCSNKNLKSFLTWANKTTGTTLPTGETIVRGGLRMNRMSLR